MHRIPILRFGEVYHSLDQQGLTDHRSGEPVASVGLANEGLIRRDLRRAGGALDSVPCAELLRICESAAEPFIEADLPLSPAEHIAALSATSGLSESLVRASMQKLHGALRQMRAVFAGLTGDLDPAVLDSGLGQRGGRRVSYQRTTCMLGAVLPSNSPGVHSIWLPAIAFKTPVALKPGREDPWTPYRLIGALVAAGCPAEAFGFYPTGHGGARELLAGCGRGILFGDAATTAQYAGNPRIQLHGPGRSKVLFGEDAADDWASQLDLLVESVAAGGGRSCINASAIVIPRHADELADALAGRLGRIPSSELAAFPRPAVAEAIDLAIERAIGPGQVITRGPRLVVEGGATYLRPTVLRLPGWEHALAGQEYPFPFVSVIETAQDEMLSCIGPTLAATAITSDAAFRGALLACPSIDRLNLGPVPTNRVEWDQPHEGNLFDLLWRRRAVALAGCDA